MNNQNENQQLIKKEYIVIHQQDVNSYYCIRAIVGIITLIILVVVIIIAKQSL